ncbi:MAG: 50S ribosomal protein L13 [Planctomycetes bacterium]|jgi:large subunit ribosomal protein L13|nr:50S ribosomal protein L13 [Planctomycetota bacterium]
MKSYMAKKDQVQQRWLLVDADGAVLGRMAAKLAVILMGKDKPTWTPHVDVGDYVVVINAEKVKITGAKAEQKYYDSYSRYPGGYKVVPYAKMMAKKPEFIIETAVRKMLPKTQMGRHALKKLKVFRGPEHEHQAQKPEKVELF